MKPAFSTVACPDWTLDRVAESAEHVGAMGVELRTFGSGSTEFASDPALISSEKLRMLFGWAGVTPCCLATSIAFDETIFPPVIGQVISDTERSVREAKSAIDLAQSIECPFVRVFGFEYHGSENRANANGRIINRLSKVVDHCRNKGVRLVIENGGSFATAAALSELLDLVPDTLLGVAYNLTVAKAAGESIENGLNVLGDRLLLAKMKDLKDGRPCALGSGDHDAAGAIAALAASGFRGYLIYEYDRAWLDMLPPPPAQGVRKPGLKPVQLPDALEVLKTSMKFMYERLGAAEPVRKPRPAQRV